VQSETAAVTLGQTAATVKEASSVHAVSDSPEVDLPVQVSCVAQCDWIAKQRNYTVQSSVKLNFWIIPQTNRIGLLHKCSLFMYWMSIYWFAVYFSFIVAATESFIDYF